MPRPRRIASLSEHLETLASMVRQIERDERLPADAKRSLVPPLLVAMNHLQSVLKKEQSA